MRGVATTHRALRAFLGLMHFVVIMMFCSTVMMFGSCLVIVRSFLVKTTRSMGIGHDVFLC